MQKLSTKVVQVFFDADDIKEILNDQLTYFFVMFIEVIDPRIPGNRLENIGHHQKSQKKNS
jgi:hypothetical protein